MVQGSCSSTPTSSLQTGLSSSSTYMFKNFGIRRGNINRIVPNVLIQLHPRRPLVETLVESVRQFTYQRNRDQYAHDFSRLWNQSRFKIITSTTVSSDLHSKAKRLGNFTIPLLEKLYYHKNQHKQIKQLKYTQNALGNYTFITYPRIPKLKELPPTMPQNPKLLYLEGEDWGLLEEM